MGSRGRKYQVDEGLIIMFSHDPEVEDFFLLENIKTEEDLAEFLLLNFSIPFELESNIEIKMRFGYEDWKIFNTFDNSVFLNLGIRRL